MVSKQKLWQTWFEAQNPTSWHWKIDVRTGLFTHHEEPYESRHVRNILNQLDREGTDASKKEAARLRVFLRSLYMTFLHDGHEEAAKAIELLVGKKFTVKDTLYLGGASQGYLLVDHEGKHYYGKKYGNPDQARCEWIANRIYAQLGVPVLEGSLSFVNDTLFYVTPLLEKYEHMKLERSHPLTVIVPDGGLTEKQRLQLSSIYVPACLLLDWDAVGTGNTPLGNLLLYSDSLTLVDHGGSLLFSGLNGKKPPSALNDNVEELTSMLDVSLNTITEAAFRLADKAAMARGIDTLCGLEDKDVRMIVSCAGLDPDTTAFIENLIIRRRDAIIRKRTVLESLNVARISTTSLRHRVFFVHGIHPNFTPDGNSLLESAVSWQQKLDIALSLAPKLAVSTTGPGDSFRNLWSRMGVVLSEGVIHEAHSGDAGTVAEKLHIRSSTSSSSKDMDDAVAEAISERQDGYNEFVADNCKIFGFYVCTEDTGKLMRPDLAPFQEIREKTQSIGLPLLVLENGRLYYAEFAGEEPRKEREITVQEAISKPANVDQSVLASLRAVLLSGRSPFKARTFEAELVRSWIQGKMTYLELNAPHASRFVGKKTTFKPARKSERTIPEGAPITAVLTAHVDDFVFAYFVYSGMLFVRKISLRESSSSLYNLSNDSGFNIAFHRTGYIMVSVYSEQLSKTPKNNWEHLREVRALINRLNKEETHNGQAEENKRQRIEKLSMHLYGFSVQAESQNEENVATKAHNMAALTFPEDRYRELISRRVDERGRFRFSLDDIAA